MLLQLALQEPSWSLRGGTGIAAVGCPVPVLLGDGSANSIYVDEDGLLVARSAHGIPSIESEFNPASQASNLKPAKRAPPPLPGSCYIESVLLLEADSIVPLPGCPESS